MSGAREPGRDLRDAHQVALELTEQRGHNALMLERIEGLRENVNTMQTDVRAALDTLGTVARQQADIGAHGSGLERMDARLAAQGDRITFWRGLVIGVIAMVAALSGAVSYIVQTGFDRAGRESQRIEDQQIRETARQDRAIEEFRRKLEDAKKLEPLK